jgi:proteic killer suppression protein
MAIIGCKDRKTERFLAGDRVKDFQAFADAAARALTKLQAAVVLADLRNPPSNRFEALRGDRNRQYSIRINAQYRVCFKWAPHAPVPNGTDALLIPGDAYDVEITDYH